MQATKKILSDTKVELTLVASPEQLKEAKQATLQALAKEIKLPGFRQGKVPLNLVEKNANPATLQTEFLDHLMNHMYSEAIDQHKLRPVSQPNVAVKKFVPFDTVEVVIEVEVIGEVKLADYKKIKLAKKAVKITAKDIDGVLAELTSRQAEKKDITRAAKNGDVATINFKGVDAKTKEPIAGADGDDYPLELGSKAFIPGFEEEVVGLKTGDEKTFDIVFPADYGAKELQNRKVQFTIKVIKVQESIAPKLDDAFAAKVGPFKTVDELKADIQKQLETEKEYQGNREYNDELLLKITRESKVAIPESLVEEQIDRLIAEQKQNLMYRGQTWQEFLDSQDMDEDKYRASIKPDAELRVKAGIVLGEIAEVEKITATPEELEIRMQLLKGQYNDAKMQAELDKPESRREIMSRMISEKTVDKLVGYANAK